MGEVYRADDLSLGQTIALKFLPEELAPDRLFRERFFSEVRIARQLSHPNICRVYHIEEGDDRSFLTMEYVDGEDLKSLIRRIGYLPNEKALDIARQLSAGLSAAHQRGVLHRDLKPGNIMIDGHGRVRIMDFGLAINAEDATQAIEEIGTPAYMAPEQFAGKPASIRSDIYALGLVLYEVYCGQRAFQGSTRADIYEEKRRHTPIRPSEIRSDMDPLVERVLLRCMDPDPSLRPESVTQVAVALPGGDPLAAAVAAGETPSPEMVAASGERDGLHPAVALALLAVVIIGSIAAIPLLSRIMLFQRVPLGKSRDVLSERAKEIIDAAGYPAGVDSALGFEYDMNLLRHFQKMPRTQERWKQLEAINPIVFWYRESPRPLEHRIIDRASPQSFEVISRLTPLNAPMESSGDIYMQLDSSGRLRRFAGIPLLRRTSGGSQATPDWQLLLSKAGFDPARWSMSEPKTIPLYYADAQAAWQGSIAGAPDIPLRIEAASYGGKLVRFEVSGPWDNTEVILPGPIRTNEKIANAIVVLFVVACILGGLLFARHNIRLGRGDRRAAARLSLFAFVSIGIAWLFGEHHVATLWELYLFLFGFMGFALFISALIWVLYIAFEPFVRRRWPQVLIAWTRVLSKQWRDPLVGRHVLIGSAVGVSLAYVLGLISISPTWFGQETVNRIVLPTLLPVSGTGAFISALIYFPIAAMATGMEVVFLLFLLRTLLRSERIATVLVVFVFGAINLASDEPWLAVPAGLLIAGAFLFLLNRHGLVALVVAYFVYLVFVTFPMTLNTSSWYFSIGFAALFVVLAVALWGFRISIGKQGLLDAIGIPQ